MITTTIQRHIPEIVTLLSNCIIRAMIYNSFLNLYSRRLSSRVKTQDELLMNSQSCAVKNGDFFDSLMIK